MSDLSSVRKGLNIIFISNVLVFVGEASNLFAVLLSDTVAFFFFVLSCCVLMLVGGVFYLFGVIKLGKYELGRLRRARILCISNLLLLITSIGLILSGETDLMYISEVIIRLSGIWEMFIMFEVVLGCDEICPTPKPKLHNILMIVIVVMTILGILSSNLGGFISNYNIEGITIKVVALIFAVSFITEVGILCSFSAMVFIYRHEIDLKLKGENGTVKHESNLRKS